MEEKLYVYIFFLLMQNIQCYSAHMTTIAPILASITALASHSTAAPIRAQIDVHEGKFKLMDNGNLCVNPWTPINTEEECIAAAKYLDLEYGNSWIGPNDFPDCLFANDGRGYVYFNKSPNASNVAVNELYAGVCKDDQNYQNHDRQLNKGGDDYELKGWNDQNYKNHDGRLNKGGDYQEEEEKEQWSCSCSSDKNKAGYGDCKAEHPTEGVICYVTRPSGCKDLKQSITDRGLLSSAQACMSRIQSGVGKSIRSSGNWVPWDSRIDFKCKKDNGGLTPFKSEKKEYTGVCKTKCAANNECKAVLRQQWGGPMWCHWFSRNINISKCEYKDNWRLHIRDTGVKQVESTVKCTGKTVWNCCSSTDPCQENQGDCDENDDCAGSLICGISNCNKLDSRAHKDSDCCINPEVKTRSSSIYRDISYFYGPRYVVDGLISNKQTEFFHSKLEDYPWIEITLPNAEHIQNVTLVNRNMCCGDRLKNAEIRTGMTSVPQNEKKRLSINTVCGVYLGPGKAGESNTIECASPIFSKYISIQLKDRGILALNEVKINQIIAENGEWTKYVGYDCNDEHGGEEMSPWPMISSTTVDICKGECLKKDKCIGFVMDTSGSRRRCWMVKGLTIQQCKTDTKYSTWAINSTDSAPEVKEVPQGQVTDPAAPGEIYYQISSYGGSAGLFNLGGLYKKQANNKNNKPVFKNIGTTVDMFLFMGDDDYWTIADKLNTNATELTAVLKRKNSELTTKATWSYMDGEILKNDSTFIVSIFRGVPVSCLTTMAKDCGHCKFGGVCGGDCALSAEQNCDIAGVCEPHIVLTLPCKCNREDCNIGEICRHPEAGCQRLPGPENEHDVGDTNNYGPGDEGDEVYGKVTVSGALGDGREFIWGSVNYIGQISNVVDRRRCCQKCWANEDYADTNLIEFNKVTKRCWCVKSMQGKQPSTEEKQHHFADVCDKSLGR